MAMDANVVRVRPNMNLSESVEKTALARAQASNAALNRQIKSLKHKLAVNEAASTDAEAKVAKMNNDLTAAYKTISVLESKINALTAAAVEATKKARRERKSEEQQVAQNQDKSVNN